MAGLALLSTPDTYLLHPLRRELFPFPPSLQFLPETSAKPHGSDGGDQCPQRRKHPRPLSTTIAKPWKTRRRRLSPRHTARGAEIIRVSDF
jgi:hypothetical protein